MSDPGPQGARVLPPVHWEIPNDSYICFASAQVEQDVVIQSAAKDCLADLQTVLADFYSKEEIANKASNQQRRWQECDPFSGFIVYHNQKPVGWIINGHSDFIGMSELFAWGTRDFSPDCRVRAVSAVINDFLLILKKNGVKVNQERENNNTGEDFEGIVATCSEGRLASVGKGLEMFGFTRCSPEKLNELMKTRWKRKEIPEVGTRTIDGQSYGVYVHPWIEQERLLYLREEPPASSSL